ncbi:penicillin-binding protein [Lactococcus sp. dk322]|nr:MULTISPECIES: transglycosylase domain-containing protein [unclassified Lactococcus]MQW22089.1 penicillin-binding protein [Lactococcus sp. dk101]TXK45031.1 penicillin-binding protein [Lactococcus sp. dk310]TXK51188.1 penicillin-binding protein [Lactococcus sp. dk322]
MKLFFIVLFSAILLAVIAGGSIFVYYAKDAPKLDLTKLSSAPSSQFLDASGNVIATMGTENRTLVETDNIPVQLVNAVTSIEDHRFFSTRGIDPVRIAGSFMHNLKGGSLNGGSTLDMQLIKLGMFSTDASDRNLRVKIQEAWLALQLDQKWTKEQIFTAYVNKVNMANGYYGMGTAAKAYYGKDLTALSIAQIALLAGMPQAPTTYNPYTNPTAAKYRRDLVIEAMYKYGKITDAERKTALATPIKDGLQPLKQSVTIPRYADNFLKEAKAQADELAGVDTANAGVKVYTTLDTAAQQNLYNIVNTDTYVNYPDKDLQVASTVVNVQTGAVVAQIGGRNTPSNVTFGTNEAVQTNRDWGSAMKPLVDYGPAFEDGIYTSTADTVSDEPTTYPDGTALKNWNNSYLGTMTVKSALQYSRNIPAVKTLIKVGLTNSNDFLNKVGIDLSPLVWSNAISSNLSHSTKSSAKGVNSVRMASAYAAFANEGVYTKPYYVTKIVFSDGREIDYKPEKSQAMKASTAYVITDMLKGVVQLPISTSAGGNANVPGLTALAGKTGTSNYDDTERAEIDKKYGSISGMVSPDENFVGYTPQYSMSVWTGYKNRMTPIYGDTILCATSVFRSMMSMFYPDPSTVTDWTAPSTVTDDGSYVTVNN